MLSRMLRPTARDADPGPPGRPVLSERTAGMMAAAVAAALFGSAYVATAFQLHGFSPLGGALWRSTIATVALVILANSSRGRARAAGRRSHVTSRASPAGRVGRLLVLGILGGLVFIVGMNVAVSRVGATVTAFVAGLYAILAALFAPAVLGERLQRGAVAGFGIALVGTVLLAGLAPTPGSLGGLGAGVMAAVSFGLYLVLIRRWSATIGARPAGISVVTAATSAAGLALILWVVDPPAALPRALPADVVLSTAWLALVTALGPLLAAAALVRIEASLASSLLLLNPITATLLSVVLAGERPSPVQLLGGLLVLVGMAAATDLPGAIRRRRSLARREHDRRAA